MLYFTFGRSSCSISSILLQEAWIIMTSSSILAAFSSVSLSRQPEVKYFLQPEGDYFPQPEVSYFPQSEVNYFLQPCSGWQCMLIAHKAVDR